MRRLFPRDFRIAGTLLIALLSLTVSFSAQAAWPDNRTITFVVPFPPGGNTDLLGRIEGDLRAKIFIPLQLYAGTADKGGPVSRIAGFVRAPSRDEALSLASEFRRRLSA